MFAPVVHPFESTEGTAMYQPPQFRENRKEIMHELMRSHPFATLITIKDGDICADHLPLLIHSEASQYGTIRGHIAKGNPLWCNESAGFNALAIFQGPQAYITPSWYPSKKVHGKVVPTWNYAVVHARGKLRFIDDRDWLAAHLIELTSRNERHRAAPWKISDAPRDYVERLLRGIVGFELEITSLEGKWKVSQNKEAKDRKGVQNGLLLESNQDATAIAELVEAASTEHAPR